MMERKTPQGPGRSKEHPVADKRIGIDTKHQKTVDALTSVLETETYALFETKQKLLMFAAGLGFQQAKRTPLENRDAGSAIRMDIFERDIDDGFIYCLAIDAEAETRGLNVLSDGAELVKIFEEYANTGLTILERRVLNKTNPLQELVNLINEERFPPEPEALDGFDPLLLADILGR